MILSSPWKASILGDAPCSHNPHLQAPNAHWNRCPQWRPVHPCLESPHASSAQASEVVVRCRQDVFGIFWDLLIDTFQQPRHSPRKTRMAACSGNLGLLLWVCFLKKIWAALTSKCCKRSSADLPNSGGKELFTIEGGPMSLGRDVFPHRSWELAGSWRKHVPSTNVNDSGSMKIECPKRWWFTSDRDQNHPKPVGICRIL